MGKYFLYGIIILVVLFGLNFFNVVRIPFLDVPDFLSGKEQTVTKTKESVKDIE